MNSFGKLFRISIFGESHGPYVGVVIDGCPAGLTLGADDFTDDMKRRKGGRAGTTARKEADSPTIASGLFNGRTTGAPILVLFENRDVDSSDYETLRRTPRPGQADLVALQKYGGFNDYRGGGAFSGRLTTGLVAAGVIAKKLVRPVDVAADLVEAGGSVDVEKAVEEALRANDSVGGVVRCLAKGLPAGLGEPFFDSTESLLAHLLFSVPGIKGIEFGAGFGGSRMKGSEFNDEIISLAGETRTNNAGGVNGGITSGNDLVFRVAVRPTASIGRSQRTIDTQTGGQREVSVGGRHDACFALRVPVIVEAACAIVMADLMLLEQRIPKILEVGEHGS
jgi:chorismate synthase